MFGFRICILFVKGIIQQADNFTCRYGNLHLPFEVFVSGIDKKLQPIVFFFQICKFDDFRLTARAFHIVHIESTEITGHDPARVLRYGQFQNIPLCLLERCQQCPIGLFDRLVQILAQAFLFDQNMGGGNGAINKAGVIEVDLLLKLDKLLRVFDPVHIPKKRQPKRLALAFFVAFAFPVGGKILCGLLLLRSGHSGHLIARKLSLS